VKYFIKLVIVLALASVVAIYANNGIGHVVIFVKNYRLDMSLFSLIVFMIIVEVVFYFLIRLWLNLRRVTQKINNTNMVKR